jgi:hypothetical protein
MMTFHLCDAAYMTISQSACRSTPRCRAPSYTHRDARLAGRIAIVDDALLRRD